MEESSDFWSSFLGLQAFGIGYAILIIFLCIGFWLVFRPLILWYFKINKILNEQKLTNDLLKDILYYTKRNGKVDVNELERKLKANLSTASEEKPVEASKTSDWEKYQPKS